MSGCCTAKIKLPVAARKRVAQKQGDQARALVKSGRGHDPASLDLTAARVHLTTPASANRHGKFEWVGSIFVLANNSQ